jgi:signal peptide peptidase SppA
MNNPFFARFDRVPSLVSADMQGRFESCLHQVQMLSARLDSATDKPRMNDGDPDDFWFAEDDWRSFLRPYTVVNGVLQIPVKGVLLHDFPYQFFNYATGYPYIWQAFKRGMADDDVLGIALICDSPGGEVAGNFDLVDKMFAFRGEKPVQAFAAESAYSAAYSIASVADKITVSRTGGVGSIGVITMHVDLSGAYDQAGIKITYITFGAHKADGNATEPLPKDVKDRIQARIDELGEIFVSTVARNRGMDAKAIRDTEALCFTATQAVSNGLADEIGSLDDAVAAYAASLSEEDDLMTTKDSAVSAANDTALASARTEGMDQGLQQGRTEGAATERARIVAIIGSEEGKKRPKAALSIATKTSLSVEEATAHLADLDEEKATSAAADPNAPKGKDGAAKDFATAMDKSKHPELGAPAGEEDEEAQLPRHERAMRAAGHKPKKAA